MGLFIVRRVGKSYYFDSFGFETPPLFVEYIDLCSNERIQKYDESYCGAYCLHMIHLIDRRFILEVALDILVNQVKCPKMYDKCFCFSCKVKSEIEVNVNDNQGTCLADTNDKVDQGTCFADANVNGFHPQHTADGNGNDNQRTLFADGN